jgi:hypothetical protein
VAVEVTGANLAENIAGVIKLNVLYNMGLLVYNSILLKDLHMLLGSMAKFTRVKIALPDRLVREAWKDQPLNHRDVPRPVEWRARCSILEP